MKNTLITGGAGFIGSELVRQLNHSGYQVTVFDNLSFGRKRNLPKNVKFIKGDIRNKNDVQKLFRTTYDWVFHLAALHFIPYCNEHPEETIDVNVIGTFLFLSELKKKKPKKLFFSSTAAVYGVSSRPHKETEKPNPLDIYGSTKLMGEEIVQQFSRETRIPCIVGRLFNAFGPRETNPHLIPSIAAQVLQQKKIIHLGNLKPKRDYIHTNDVSLGILQLMSKSKEFYTLVNIGTGAEHSVLEVVQAFSKSTGTSLQIKSQNHLRRKVERLHLSANITRLKKITGFVPKIHLLDGIRELVS